MSDDQPRILALTGGVGGAKLAVGLAEVLPPAQLCFAVNTGDDFEHLGLHIAPDIDSLTYALAGENNTELGWGRAGESWQFIETLGALGGEDWFRLGDRDLALHMRRTGLLRDGATLTEATATICEAMGITHEVLPMSDDPVRTIVHTAGEALAFQHYFVRERCAPAVTGFSFQGSDTAHLNPALSRWLETCDGVIVCPSNPYVSVAPMLSLPGFEAMLRKLPVVAVTPIVGGLALKGPAAKMMAELNVPASASAVAIHYAQTFPGLINGFVVDETDPDELQTLEKSTDITAITTNTIMLTLADRVALAERALGFLQSLSTR